MSEPAKSSGSRMTQMTSLHEERLDFAFQALKATGATRVLDLGCGSGSLLYRLLSDPQFQTVTGLENSSLSLQQARTILATYLSESAPRIRLIRGSYAESNPALAGYDAAAMVETIEHVHPGVLSRVEIVVFGEYRPRYLFMTTPNREYNPLFGLATDQFREQDHRFEWDRDKFRRWASGVAKRNGYQVEFGGIGECHPEFGHPTQTAFFTQQD